MTSDETDRTVVDLMEQLERALREAREASPQTSVDEMGGTLDGPDSVEWLRNQRGGDQ